MSPRILYKAPIAAAVIGLFALSALVGLALFRGRLRQRRFQVRNVSFHARLFLRLTGVRVQTELVPFERVGRGSLIVSNHVSYLDAMVLAASYPAILVTSVEVRETPFLGHISRLCGCVFVERRSRATINEEVERISGILADGFNVVLFPEGTSTDGSEVLPFKRSLFRTAVGAGAAVKPMTLNYRSIDGEPVSASNRDRVFYYGDLRFGPQFLDFLGNRSVMVQLKEAEMLADAPDHRVLAERAFESVRGGFIPVV